MNSAAWSQPLLFCLSGRRMICREKKMSPHHWGSLPLSSCQVGGLGPHHLVPGFPGYVCGSGLKGLHPFLLSFTNELWRPGAVAEPGTPRALSWLCPGRGSLCLQSSWVPGWGPGGRQLSFPGTLCSCSSSKPQAGTISLPPLPPAQFVWPGLARNSLSFGVREP